MATIIHVPYTYFPDPSGGTEVYVHGLAKFLETRGWRNLIVAPGKELRAYEYEGIAVRRFTTDGRRPMASAYCEPDEVAAGNFKAIVDEISPAVVHLHAHTSAVSGLLADVAHSAGASVVVTYHTPTASCARGTMMLFGGAPCDGRIEAPRCTACAFTALGAPRPIAQTVSMMPGALAALLADLPIETSPLSALRVPGLIVRRGERFVSLMSKADAVVAVCKWVRDVLERNGVPAEKITVSRQGIARSVVSPRRQTKRGAAPLRIAYFGRLDRTKGIDLLISALRRRPLASLFVDVYAVRQPCGATETDLVDRLAANEQRVRILPPVEPAEVIGVMANYDFIVVPSRWLETGPLVVLEAFAAGVPVLGSDLGGIAELVRDNIDGILVSPDNVEAWAEKIAQLSRDPEVSERLRQNIRPPRTMDDVAAEMSALYSRLTEARDPPGGERCRRNSFSE